MEVKLTSFSKLGFAGNTEPQYTFPTAIATREIQTGSGAKTTTGSSATTGKASHVSIGPGMSMSNLSSKRGLEDLDFYIGDEAVANSKTYGLSYPIRHGQIENWDQMERYWEQSIFKYLRCEPEDHLFLLVRCSSFRRVCLSLFLLLL